MELRPALLLSLRMALLVAPLAACSQAPSADQGFARHDNTPGPTTPNGPFTPAVAPLGAWALFPDASMTPTDVLPDAFAQPAPMYVPMRPPHVAMNSPAYLNDPAHPYNRGGWVNTVTPLGQPMQVWSTMPDPVQIRPYTYPDYRGGVVPSAHRWDPVYRR